MVFGCTILDGLMLHHYFVDNFGNLLELIHITPELSTFTLFTLIIIVTSDLVFASRLWRLKRVHWALITVVVLTAIGALIPGIMLVVDLFRNPSLPALNSPSRKIEIGFINILAAISQCISTVALWWSFRAHMGETAILQRFCTLAINRGVLLTLCQLLVAFAFLSHPEKLYWAPFHQALAPLYFITMLSTLNARNELRAAKEPTISISIGQSAISIPGMASTYHHGQAAGRDPEAGFVNPSLAREGSSYRAGAPVTQEHQPSSPTSLIVNHGSRRRDKKSYGYDNLEKGKQKEKEDIPVPINHELSKDVVSVPRRLPPIPK
ncbi:hypothetical protein Moror_807 [Moniliophthora roreri MCA 2997]|uniref:DUF6534 domain-containing protein n=1 Tax=Moniliophthora roreri (strain MCA 2997) TaxID=1381753 RepID=V2X812_MONRO|nr:hypothetical protein Moror_807 [Moniliophthora roreri MCA 2997]